MTQHPGYGQAYYPVQKSPRPTSVTVLAIIGIIWGSITVLCNIVGAFGLLALDKLTAASGQPNPLTDLFKDQPSILKFLVIALVIRLALSILLLVSSIGALSLKGWGRTGMLAYAGLLVLITIGEVIFSMTVMMPALEKAMPTDPAMRQQMMAQQWASQLIQPIIGLIYPAFVLIYMNKAHVKEAFRTGGATPQGPYSQ